MSNREEAISRIMRLAETTGLVDGKATAEPPYSSLADSRMSGEMADAVCVMAMDAGIDTEDLPWDRIMSAYHAAVDQARNSEGTAK